MNMTRDRFTSTAQRRNDNVQQEDKFLKKMARSINEIVKKYHKTEKGILTQRYAKMKYDAKNKCLDIISQNAFKVLSRDDENFRHIYYDFISSGFDKKLSPVLERINRNEGFVEGNLRWVFQKDKKKIRSIKKLI